MEGSSPSFLLEKRRTGCYYDSEGRKEGLVGGDRRRHFVSIVMAPGGGGGSDDGDLHSSNGRPEIPSGVD